MSERTPVEGSPRATMVTAADGSTVALLWPDEAANDAHRRVAIRPFVFVTLVFTALFVVLGWWSKGLGTTPGSSVLGLLAGGTAWFSADRSGFVAWRRVLVDRAGIRLDHVTDLPTRLRDDVALGPDAGVTPSRTIRWDDVPIVLADDTTLVVGAEVFALEGLAEPEILADFAQQLETARSRRIVGAADADARAALAALTTENR